MDELEHRVRRLEHIELAKAAGARYARACDAKDVRWLLADVFSDEPTLHIPGADHVGRDAVGAFFESAFGTEPGTRRHFVANAEAEVVGDGAVDVDAYFFFVSADAESVIGWGSYRYRAVVDGDRARISAMTIGLDMFTTLDKGWAAAAVPER